MSHDELELRSNSNPSAEEFTRSPKRTKRRITRHCEVDGIDLDRGDFLPRDALVDYVLKDTRENGLSINSSPPGTGKTSLLSLLKKRIKSERETASGFYLRPSEPCKDDFDLYSYVQKKTGVSNRDESLTEDLRSKSEIWILFDDSQKLYGEKFENFWEDLVKTRSDKDRFGTTQIRVVVAATYYLISDSTSPVSFEAEHRLGVQQLLLQKSEAKELFALRSKYPTWETYLEALYYLTNGNAAAFTIGMNNIYDETKTGDIKSNGKLDELVFLQERLIQNDTYFRQLGRCFSSGALEIDKASHDILMSTLVDSYKVDMGDKDINGNSAPVILKLRKAGILDDGGRFSSPAAARFYYSRVFPRSVDPYRDQPATSDDLIVQAAKQMSARRLRHACSKKHECHKEAVFQQLFHEAIASLLPLSYRIIPEYGTEAVVDGVHKTGELGFYIRNGNKWALELLRDGQKISEHLSRIPGKYRNVVADEWLVVDCRVGKEPRTRDKK